MGNVSKIYKNGLLTTRYTYDGLNRLIREDNRDFAKTYRIDYDDKGNITGKYTYNFTLCSMDDLYEKTPTATQTYEYDLQSDRLHAINGNIIGYDMYGFPSRYGLDGQFCTWYDNYLSGFGSNTFVRDNRGRRIRKNNILFIYDSQDRLIKQSNGVEFFYDHTGVAGISYNGTLYTYEKDIFGNVISILDRDGRRVVQYMYDAWGNHKIVDGYGNTITSSTHIGTINPIRYRSYYYDTETGLYYLHARYYDPVIGRFISPDDVDYIDPEAINGLNLYAYCGNNPVMNIDPSGHSVIAILLTFLGLYALTMGIEGAVAAAQAGGDVGDVLIGFGKGVVNGLLLGVSVLAIAGGLYLGPTPAGVALMNWGFSTLFNYVEVGVTQYKKSIHDGDNVWQAFNDVNNALFANAGNILIGKSMVFDVPLYGTKVSSKIPLLFDIYLDYSIGKMFLGSSSFWNSTMGVLTGKAGKFSFISYFATFSQFNNMLKAIIGTPDFENSKWILY